MFLGGGGEAAFGRGWEVGWGGLLNLSVPWPSWDVLTEADSKLGVG